MTYRLFASLATPVLSGVVLRCYGEPEAMARAVDNNKHPIRAEY